MQRNSSVLSEIELWQIPVAALFAALGVVFPQFFHLLGLGPAFLPMFLPVMMGSLLLTWRFALAIAVICPLTSFAMTGMPPLAPPILPVMMIELIVISLILSLLYVHWRQPLWLTLPLAILTDRMLLFFLISMIAPLFGWTHPFFSIALVLGGIPGIILQLIALPLTLKLIRKRLPYSAVQNLNSMY